MSSLPRYADRVKELGTSDPVRSADADMEDIQDIQEQEVSSSDSIREDSDLAQIRSLNDGECSADWYNFQENLAQLQVLEEEVVDSHKKLLDSLENWVQQDATLLSMTNEVDYDQDGKQCVIKLNLLILILFLIFSVFSIVGGNCPREKRNPRWALKENSGIQV